MGNTERIGNQGNANLFEALAYVAWIVALLSTVGSLFFSEVMNFPPCALCWYQRIAVYPLVLIIGAGIVLRDARMKYYALPLCLCGLALAVYHNLLYYGVVSETLAPCSQGVSCTETQIEWFGFVTIPLLSLAAFAVIALCLLFYKPKE
ncbi:MAG: disulfide bond formation protein B [Acidobacteria bacterium]|nr:disulfide bond formation protein B [Acidobacteriota bacterium]MCA1636923.1 disulfide bond formation protein B [Acidobacteriota bacterium]